MKIKDLKFKATGHMESDTLFSIGIDAGRITVLDRMTGYGGGIRDVETGFLDNDNKFWLASGQFDIRTFPELTIDEAILTIKKNANTCVVV